MAKKRRKRRVNKSESIRQYLLTNPNAPAAEVVSALKEQKISVTPNNVNNVRSKLRKADGGMSGQPVQAEEMERRKPAAAQAKGSSGKKINKTKAVRAFVAEHPEMGPKAASAALRLQGIQVSPTHFSNIKSSMKAKGIMPETRQAEPAAEAEDVSVSALFAAKDLVQKLGGIEQARQAIATLAQLAHSPQ